jgi:hypothetical protein
MRKITREIVRAFENRTPHRIDNSRTDGTSLFLFGNKIAEWREDGLWVTNAGWDSRTTYERLNGLTGVHVRKQRGSLLLNNLYWDGRWTHVDTWNNMGGISYEPETQTEQVADEPEFDLTSEWMDAGYSRPVYSIYHTLAQENLEQVETMLNEAGIPSRRMESDTAGTYRPNYFVVVRPEDVVRASAILCESYSLL